MAKENENLVKQTEHHAALSKQKLEIEEQYKQYEIADTETVTRMTQEQAEVVSLS